MFCLRELSFFLIGIIALHWIGSPLTKPLHGQQKKIADAIDVAVVEEATKEVVKDKDQEAEEKKNAYKVGGTFELIHEPLKKVLKMKWERDSLKFDLPETYQDVNTALQEVRQSIRGGSGGSNSGEMWSQYLYGQRMSGNISRGMRIQGPRGMEQDPNAFEIYLLETTGAEHEVAIHGSKTDDFTISIGGGIKPLSLQVRQAENGVVSVHDIEGDHHFAGSAKSFQDFCRKYPLYVKDRLMPVLSGHGIAAPVTRYNPVARDQVLSTIRKMDADRVAAFRERFKDLDSKKFDEREAATKLLLSQFEEWKDVIRHAIANEEYSFETRVRLKRALDENSSEEDQQLVSMVVSEKLAENAEYLIWLLENEKEEANIQAIIGQLTKITKQEFGPDVAKWKQWIEASLPAVSDDYKVVSKSMAEEIGYLQGMRKQISQIAAFRLEEDRLVINRDLWRDRFGGKTVKELVETTRKEIKERGLPANWFNSRASHVDDEADYAQVFFDEISQSVPSQLRQNYMYHGMNTFNYRNSSLGRHFEQRHMLGMLEFHQYPAPDARGVVNNSGKKKVEYVRLALREKEEGWQALDIYENRNQLRIILSSNRANAIIYFQQNEDLQVSLYDLRGGEVFKSIEAENARKMIDENQEYLQKELLPILENYGLQLSEELGGPFEFENAELKRK